MALRMLRPVLDKAIRNNTPPEKHSYMLTTYSPGAGAPTYRDDLGISNMKTCYVYLLDKRGRIRWQGTGTATPQELQTLQQFTKQLKLRPLE